MHQETKYKSAKKMPFEMSSAKCLSLGSGRNVSRLAKILSYLYSYGDRDGDGDADLGVGLSIDEDPPGVLMVSAWNLCYIF